MDDVGLSERERFVRRLLCSFGSLGRRRVTRTSRSKAKKNRFLLFSFLSSLADVSLLRSG